MFAKFVIALLSLIVLTSCNQWVTAIPASSEKQVGLQEDVRVIRLNASNINSFSRPAQSYTVSALPVGRATDYLIGSGDLLNVIVFDHPELMIPLGSKAGADSGFYVQADGTFNFPFIGLVQARGLTASAIRSDLAERLAEFFPSPQVEVRVSAFNSQRIVVAGEVNAPNTQKITLIPTTLITAINDAGGLTDAADDRVVSVQRSGRVYEIDLGGFLNAGIEQNNPMLRAGDTITVPRRQAEEAYLLGQIAQPSAIDLSQEQITLTQAISRQGGLDEIRADASGVFVFRLVNDEMTVFQLDTSSAIGLLLGTRFALEPSDIVYVIRSSLTEWKDTISSLLPFVTAFSATRSIVE